MELYLLVNVVLNRVLWMFLVQIKIVKTMKIENENVIGNGTYPTKNGRVHKYVCKTCSKSFTSRANTILHDLRTDEETVFLALKMILKGMNLISTAEILEVKLDTVRRWLKISAEHSEEVNKVLMKDVDVDKVELDELMDFC